MCLVEMWKVSFVSPLLFISVGNFFQTVFLFIIWILFSSFVGTLRFGEHDDGRVGWGSKSESLPDLFDESRGNGFGEID